jgi:homogentisate 1,2-dioxygenase
MFGQAGNPSMGEGLAIYLYSVTASMEQRSVSFADGEVLIVPQRGAILMRTELGELRVEPEQICVVPRGIKWSLSLENGNAAESHRGYMVEVFNEGGFRLPELGVIGANGLANPLHFEHPRAKFETRTYDGWEHVTKVGGKWFHKTNMKHSPYDVVAWRGNCVPYTYDLRKFCAMGSVTFDHPDPSIFTVLTVPTSIPGVAACDFVIFPHRWMVTNHTFRPPYFHRNVMTEFMGCIKGQYDGKVGGFVPGGVSLHNRMVPHGPDAATYQNASSADLKPVYYDHGLAFMFETSYFLEITDFARSGEHREVNYAQCWGGLSRASL